MAGQKSAPWVRPNPNQLLSLGVSVLVIALAVWIGMRARQVAGELSSRRVAWTSTANQIATVRQQFRVPTSTESAVLLTESSRMGTLGVPAGEKLTLVDMVGRLAEASSLGSVRVTAVPASDSTFVADRVVVGSTIQAAPYAVAVEFIGSFANAQRFVSSLPPSVSVARLAASRGAGGALYRLILSVYELDANSGN